MIIAVLVLAFIFIACVTLKPVILSHKDNWRLWLCAYGAIAVSILVGLVIKNQTLINILVGLFIVATALVVYKIIVKKLQYRKLFNASKQDVDKVAAKILSGRNVAPDIAYWAIERLETANDTVQYAYENYEFDDDDTDDDDEIDKLMEIQEERVLPVYELAKNKYTPSHIIDYIATLDLGDDVVLGIAQNPNASPEALSLIAGQFGLSKEIVENLVDNPNITDTALGILAANIDDLHKLLSRTSKYQEQSDMALSELRANHPELHDVEDRYIIAQYSKELL